MSDTTPRSGAPWPVVLTVIGLTMTFLVTGGGALWALATSAAQSRQTADALVGLRSDVQTGLSDLKRQIESIPDISARLPLVERQLRDSEVRDAAQDQRIDSLRQRVVEIGAEVEGLKRASAVALPGARR